MNPRMPKKRGFGAMTWVQEVSSAPYSTSARELHSGLLFIFQSIANGLLLLKTSLKTLHPKDFKYLKPERDYTLIHFFFWLWILSSKFNYRLLSSLYLDLKEWAIRERSNFCGGNWEFRKVIKRGKWEVRPGSTGVLRRVLPKGVAGVRLAPSHYDARNATSL